MGPQGSPSEFNLPVGDRRRVSIPPGDGRVVESSPVGALSAGHSPGPVRAVARSRRGQGSRLLRESVLRPSRWAAPADRGTPAVARAPRPPDRSDLRGLFAVLADCRSSSGRGPPESYTEGLWLIGRHPIRPVLKHGPRSLTCARVVGWQTLGRNESEVRPRGRIG